MALLLCGPMEMSCLFSIPPTAVEFGSSSRKKQTLGSPEAAL